MTGPGPEDPGDYALPVSEWPIRQRSANGFPKPTTSIERTCARCGASFIALAPGKTGERGLWTDRTWFCSQDDYDRSMTFGAPRNVEVDRIMDEAMAAIRAAESGRPGDSDE